MKKESVKKIIANSLVLAFAVLTFIFLSQAHLTATGTIGIFSTSGDLSGYSLIDFSSGDTALVLLAICLLLGTICAGVLILTSIYGILSACGVVKSSSLDKIVRIANFVIGIVYIVLFTVGLFCAVIYSVQKNDSALVTTVSVGWALVTNFALAAFTCAATTYLFKKKKA